VKNKKPLEEQTMTKTNATITVDKELWTTAAKLGLERSKICEEALRIATGNGGNATIRNLTHCIVCNNVTNQLARMNTITSRAIIPTGELETKNYITFLLVCEDCMTKPGPQGISLREALVSNINDELPKETQTAIHELWISNQKSVELLSRVHALINKTLLRVSEKGGVVFSRGYAHNGMLTILHGTNDVFELAAMQGSQ